MLTWLALTWLCYSVIPSKRYYYGVALAPPVGAVAGMLWRDLGERRWEGLARRLAGRGKAFAVVAGIGAALMVAGALTKFPREITPYSGERKLDPKLMLASAGLLLAGIGGSGWRRFRAGGGGDVGGFWRGVLVSLAAVDVTLAIVGAVALNPLVNRQQSLRRATVELAPLVAGRADAVSLSDTQTVLFYLGLTRIRVINGAEMERLARQHAPTRVMVYSDTWERDVKDKDAWRVLYTSDFILKQGAKVLVVEAK
jgi:hypothetical protein